MSDMGVGFAQKEERKKERKLLKKIVYMCCNEREIRSY